MTPKHKELTYRSLSWLNSRTTRSGKRWATELQISDNWIADAVVFAFPQMRFYDEIEPKPESIDRLLYIFESKVSRNDYNKSFSGKYDIHKLTLVGNLHYVVTPKNLIKPDELPEGWGWLMQSGNGLREIIQPTYNPITDELKHLIGWRMLWAAYSERSSIEDWELRKGKLDLKF